MATLPPRRRATARAEMSVGVVLARGRAGADVEGRTHDLGPGGMCVGTQRPLRIDEQLEFVLALDDGTRVGGRAHVIRQHAGDVYGLRFDHLSGDGRERLAALASSSTRQTLHQPGDRSAG
jgi:PilZ domain